MDLALKRKERKEEERHLLLDEGEEADDATRRDWTEEVFPKREEGKARVSSLVHTESSCIISKDDF